MGYKIFLDDIRIPTDIYPKTNNDDWLIIRNLTIFKKTILEKGIPDYISFDNDLGENMEEGKDAAKWMVFEKWLDISEMNFKVHSANSSGVREYVEGLLNNWKKELSMQKEIKMKFTLPVPEDIMKIKDLLKQKGYKLFVVGGAVRDALLGKIPKDYDLATDALPDMIQSILSSFYKTLEVGKDFGVINVLTPSGEYEIATFRKDIGKGRRPDAVEFTTIDQDVKRRDLTINALFYDIDTEEIVDLVGGIEDLKSGIVRTVGSAEERFDEDKLRILRAIRFAGRFGSELDPNVDAALKKDSDLSNVSGERIRDEFIKGIKSAKNVKHFLELLQKYNLFQWIFGNLLLKEKGMQSLDLIEEGDIPVLLAYLLTDNNVDDVKKELNNLKYSSDEVVQISFLISLKKLVPADAFKFKKAQVNSKLSDEQIRKFAQWMKMDMNLVNVFLKFKTSVTGQELIDQGFIGKALGAEMEKRETQNFLNNL